MKTLADHTLIYDQDCPMCRVYTSAFIRGKWLDGNGRVPFQAADDRIFNLIDVRRAQDEIALVDNRTGKVTYGLTSLITILTHRIPALRPMLELRLCQWFLRHLYAFISYNRKVIAAVTPTGRNCNPSFSLPYRIAYLLFAWSLSSILLARFGTLLTGIFPALSTGRVIVFTGAPLLLQGILFALYLPRLRFDYWGNMMTVALMGALALVPALIAGIWLQNPALFLVYFLLLSIAMIFEHWRRMHLLGLGLTPTVSWLLCQWMAILWLCYC